uniref:Uncharacterized protein n=1 Tax=Solanum lycopersicum TaxID=4081 RepID=A0A3Q7HC28_SOLLC
MPFNIKILSLHSLGDLCCSTASDRVMKRLTITIAKSITGLVQVKYLKLSMRFLNIVHLFSIIKLSQLFSTFLWGVNEVAEHVELQNLLYISFLRYEDVFLRLLHF